MAKSFGASFFYSMKDCLDNYNLVIAEEFLELGLDNTLVLPSRVVDLILI